MFFTGYQVLIKVYKTRFLTYYTKNNGLVKFPNSILLFITLSIKTLFKAFGSSILTP